MYWFDDNGIEYINELTELVVRWVTIDELIFVLTVYRVVSVFIVLSYVIITSCQ